LLVFAHLFVQMSRTGDDEDTFLFRPVNICLTTQVREAISRYVRCPSTQQAYSPIPTFQVFQGIEP